MENELNRLVGLAKEFAELCKNNSEISSLNDDIDIKEFKHITSVHMSLKGLSEIFNADVEVLDRGDGEFPYKVSKVVEGVNFYAIGTADEVNHYFPGLIEEYQKLKKNDAARGNKNS